MSLDEHNAHTKVDLPKSRLAASLDRLSSTMRRRLVRPLASVAFVAVLLTAALSPTTAFAAPTITQTLKSGNGTVGATDSAVTYALPWNATPAPAWIVNPYPGWSTPIPGTQWINSATCGWGYGLSACVPEPGQVHHRVQPARSGPEPHAHREGSRRQLRQGLPQHEPLR